MSALGASVFEVDTSEPLLKTTLAPRVLDGAGGGGLSRAAYPLQPPVC